MKTINNTKIIGVDHGYGNMKTASHCFPTGIDGYDSEPLFTKDMLVYDGRYYLVGEGHKEFVGEKSQDEDFYLLTLVAVAMELHDEGLTEADVFLAAGLPLTWTTVQKADFAAYLSRNEEVHFVWQKESYHIRIQGVRIYPQGFAAVAESAAAMEGVNMIADIGNGTMNVLYICDGKPLSGKMYTEKFGTYQCTLVIREAFMRKTQREVSDHVINKVLRTGKANIHAGDLRIIRDVASAYVQDIFRRLREHGYDENTMLLYVTGGGGCLVKIFCRINPNRVIFVEDICAAAKGYEYMAELQFQAGVIT